MGRRVLVVSSGDGTGLNFTRSLRLADNDYTVIGLDTNLDDYHASEADTRYLTAWDGEPKRLVSTVNDIVERESIDLVYCADTGPELLALARLRSEVAARSLLPDPADHEVMEDKWATWQALRDSGVPVPNTILVQGRDDIHTLLGQYDRVWLRNRHGSGGAGSLGTGSLDLAVAWVDEHSGWGQFTAAQELTRRTATFSGLWFDGVLVASQLRERTGWKYGSTVAAVTGVTAGQSTVHNPELHELAVSCVRSVAAVPHGAIGVDFTYSSDGQPLPTEVQPARFYSSMHFLASVGLNLPDLFCTLGLEGGLGTVPDNLLNPIREPHFWVKSVDKLPQLLTLEQYRADVHAA